MTRLLKAVATELAKYKLDFAVFEEFISNKLDTEWAVDFIYFFFFCKCKWIANKGQDLWFIGEKYQHLSEIIDLMSVGFIVVSVAGNFRNVPVNNVARNDNWERILTRE